MCFLNNQIIITYENANIATFPVSAFDLHFIRQNPVMLDVPLIGSVFAVLNNPLRLFNTTRISPCQPLSGSAHFF